METGQGSNQFCHNRHGFLWSIFRKSLYNSRLRRFLYGLWTRVCRGTLVSSCHARTCGSQAADFVFRDPSTLYIHNKVGESDYKPRSACHFRSQISLEQQHPKTL